jgi:hypothetical protein
MKVIFKYGIKTFSGTINNMVYGSYNKDNICFGRDYVRPKLTENNTLRGKIMSNLASVYRNVSPAYLQDLETYADRHAVRVPKTKLAPNAFALFIKMMYAWMASDPEHVDLPTVTVADIVAMQAPVRTIAGAVTAELLPYVSISADLTSDIQ